MIPSAGGVGISNNGAVSLTNSTIANTGSDGVSSGGAVDLTNSTITGATNNGISAGAVLLVYSDVVGNATATGNDNISSVSLTAFGSVVTGFGAGSHNCATGTVTSQGWNFADDTTCGFTGTGDTQGPGHNPLLGALANNGGPTKTLLPQNGSPLIDAIPTASCQAGAAAGVTTDQRGFPRPHGSGCDTGSVEVGATSPTTPTTTPTTPTSTPAAPATPTPISVQPTFTG
jgi:hypothetical protein